MRLCQGGIEQKHKFSPLGLLLVLTLLFTAFSHLKIQENEVQSPKESKIHRLIVAADKSWTDTGLDVAKKQEVYFKARGMISLQKGNPMAYCGPDGYNLKTVQQPLPEENIGALIGRVVYLVSVERDEETGEEIRNEIVEKFHIGEEKRVEMAMGGHLFLGINENVVGDNSGEYEVILVLGDIPLGDILSSGFISIEEKECPRREHPL